MTKMAILKHLSVALCVVLSSSSSLVAAQDFCYGDLTVIYNEISDDSLVDTPKRYVLCPDTVYPIGFIVPGVGTQGGQSPLIPRSNAEFLCGVDGSSANNCTLLGGDYGVLAAPIFFPEDTSVDNVLFKGLTFEAQDLYGIFVGTAGTNITFEDIIVKEQVNFAPVLVNYPTEDLEDPMPLEVTFDSCLFANNTQRPQILGVEFGIISIKGDEHTTVNVDDCIFSGNDYGSPINAPIGYAIQAFSNTALILKNTCFFDNSFLGGGTVIVAEETFFVLIGNYADGEAEFILLCDFVARYPTAESNADLNPQCIPPQSDVCTAAIY